MAALTDLTWQQLADHLPDGAITWSTQYRDDGDIVIRADLVTNLVSSGMNGSNVVKFFAVLLSAANKAQIAANAEQAEGERLTAFSPATIGNSANGFVTLTRPFVCRSELSTATNIIGTSG